LPAAGSVALSLVTGGIRRSGSIFLVLALGHRRLQPVVTIRWSVPAYDRMAAGPDV